MKMVSKNLTVVLIRDQTRSVAKKVSVAAGWVKIKISLKFLPNMASLFHSEYTSQFATFFRTSRQKICLTYHRSRVHFLNMRSAAAQTAPMGETLL